MNFDYLKQYVGPFRFYVFVVAAVLVCGFIGFELGNRLEKKSEEDLRTLRQTVNNLAEENASLTRDLNVMGVELHVQKLANSEAQGIIEEGMIRETQLRERLAFFEKIMAPELEQEGFVIDAFDVTPAASEGYFRFDLVLMQQDKVKGVLKGTVEVELEGSRDGNPVRLPLLELMEEGTPAIAFSFKYFQVIEGLFRLPQGFEPEFIHVSAEIFQFKRKRGDLKTRFAWQDPHSAAKIPQ